jgi:hypothetical protein
MSCQTVQCGIARLEMSPEEFFVCPAKTAVIRARPSIIVEGSVYSRISALQEQTFAMFFLRRRGF